jgi:hypothetical protein
MAAHPAKCLLAYPLCLLKLQSFLCLPLLDAFLTLCTLCLHSSTQPGTGQTAPLRCTCNVGKAQREKNMHSTHKRCKLCIALHALNSGGQLAVAHPPRLCAAPLLWGNWPIIQVGECGNGCNQALSIPTGLAHHRVSSHGEGLELG